MTSIERTACPRFKRLITAHELHLFFSPTRDELEWAAGATDGDEQLPALLLILKSYQHMGCFPALEDVPEQVVEFVRRAVELPEGTLPVYQAERAAKHHRGLIRRRVGVAYDQAEARRIAEPHPQQHEPPFSAPSRLDGLGDSAVRMDGVAARKITDFAGEADAGDAPALRDCTPVKRLALIACLVHKARMRVRDDLATMFCKHVATKIKKAKTELEEIRLAEREITKP